MCEAVKKSCQEYKREKKRPEAGRDRIPLKLHKKYILAMKATLVTKLLTFVSTYDL
jgi:hypothetical protein